MKLNFDYNITLIKPKKNKYCCCIMVLNEGERIQAQLTKMSLYADIVDIVVNDGYSTDESLGIEFLKENGVTTLLQTHQIGLSNALRMALNFACNQGYQGVITIDGNGKDGIEALPDFIKQLDLGFDFVQGSRFLAGGKHQNTPFDRYISIRLILPTFYYLKTGFWYTDGTNGFRALSMKFIKDPRVQPFREVFTRFSLLYYFIYKAAIHDFRLKEIPVARFYPSDGSVPTKINSLRLKFLNLYEMLLTLVGSYDPKDKLNI